MLGAYFLVTYFDQIAIENTNNQAVNIFLGVIGMIIIVTS